MDWPPAKNLFDRRQCDASDSTENVILLSFPESPAYGKIADLTATPKSLGDKMDWAKIVGDVGGNQYERRIEALKARNIDTSSIESTVNAALASYSGARD